MVTNVFGDKCKAEWKKWNKWVCFTVEVRPGILMTSELGKIRQKNDGRWEWTTLPCDYFSRPDGVRVTKQGVCPTEDEAKRLVETKWGLHAEPAA